jgi:anti-sigma factor RsiW
VLARALVRPFGVCPRRQHVLNLFTWPTAGPHEAPRAATQQGYRLVHWMQRGMTSWAVSDLNEQELQEFVQLGRDRGPPGWRQALVSRASQ